MFSAATAESARFESRRYRIESRGAEAEAAYSPSPLASVRAGAAVSRRRDVVGARAATVVRVPPDADFAFPTEGVLRAITPQTRIIFLNTPNNPTGQLIAREDLVRIAQA